jgi:Na+-driven multidrug efflux pump
MLKKEFWKYFFTTYKNAKWLILRYLIVAVYLTVSSILANKMNLIDLTYFNAIMEIAAFGDLIGFGLSNGVGIFVNQNIKNKDKVDYYIKVGLYLDIIFSLLFIILLAIFYKPILHNLLDLPNNINYSFYFIMLIYIFFVCILNYFVHTFSNLEMFMSEMIISIIQCVLIVLGFIIIYYGFNLSLSLIPIVYILTMICCIIYSIINLNYNKATKINIFKAVKIKFVKKEGIIIWRMAIAQIVWQVGYTMLAYFLLQVSEVIFNQYAYFENVLDIFNGLFFSFITLTSVDICRRLGEGNFDEAYKDGEYSLYSTLIIWFAYFILSLIFSYPIINGMSSDIKSYALLSMILYVTMHLFRFLSWNLISYILCWGGELKILVWQEVFVTIYFIVFYFIGKYLPQNIYLSYGIITIPVIFQTILGYCIFRRKKWMKKLSNDEDINND